MTRPDSRPRQRDRVVTELSTVTARSLTAVEQDAIVEHILRAGVANRPERVARLGAEVVFDELLAAFASGMRTWWGTPTMRA